MRSGSSSEGVNREVELEGDEMSKSVTQTGGWITDWRKLFVTSTDQSLNYFPPRRSEGKVIVCPSAEVCEEGEWKWRNAIVA